MKRRDLNIKALASIQQDEQVNLIVYGDSKINIEGARFGRKWNELRVRIEKNDEMLRLCKSPLKSPKENNLTRAQKYMMSRRAPLKREQNALRKKLFAERSEMIAEISDRLDSAAKSGDMSFLDAMEKGLNLHRAGPVDKLRSVLVGMQQAISFMEVAGFGSIKPPTRREMSKALKLSGYIPEEMDDASSLRTVTRICSELGIQYSPDVKGRKKKSDT